MSFFAGKVVVVTGSSNGIGRGIAVLFAKQGSKVTITGRNAASLEETKQLCKQAGAKTLEETKQLCKQAGAKTDDLLELIGDVTDESFNEMLITATVEKFGKLDVLVNNVGGASFDQFGKKILDIPLSGLDKMIDLNVKPVLSLSRFAVPHLEKTKGAIVNVSSTGAYHKLYPMPIYCAAKSVLDQVTIQMAGQLIKQGIRVNSVNPGTVLTNFGVTAGAPKEMSEQMVKALGPTIPLGRVSVPEDIAKIIVFLADRSQSEVLIGHILTADGGVNLKSAAFPDA